jgi:Uma2 family endonuclease
MTKPLERSNTTDAVLEPQPFKFAVKDYEEKFPEHLMPEQPRTELIDGVIYTMPPMGEEHAFSLRTLNAKLVLRYATRAEVQQQSPLRLPDFSEPEPDFAILQPGAPGIPLAEDVFWLIEVSKTTYAFDRGKKLPIYAEHAIPEVWILNINQNRLEVYRNPSKRQDSSFGYDDPILLEPGSAVAPLAFPEELLEWW